MPGLNVEADCSRQQKKNLKRSLPWLNSELLKLMKDRDLGLKRMLMSNRVNDKGILVMLWNKSTKDMIKAKANLFI